MGGSIHLGNLPQDIILRIVNVTGHEFMAPLRLTVMVGKIIRARWIEVNNRPKKRPINWNGIIECIAKRFEKCSHLEQIQFDGNFTKIRDINEALGDIVVDKCKVYELGSFEMNIATDILKMLRSHSVQYLTLGFVNIQWNLFQDFQINYLASFFAEAIQIVPSIVFEFIVKTKSSYADECRFGRWEARQREIMKQGPARTFLSCDQSTGRSQNDVEIRVQMHARRI